MFPSHGFSGGSEIQVKVPSVLNTYKHDKTVVMHVYIVLAIM